MLESSGKKLVISVETNIATMKPPRT